MNWLKQLSKPKGCVGVEITAEHINIVVRSSSGAAITHTSSLRPDKNLASMTDWQEILSAYVGKHGLQGQSCNVVLPAKDYQLLLVEAPDVPENELREAVKWRIKDLISSPVENVVVDVFTIPADANKAGIKMLYVVVSDLQHIQSLIELVAESELVLQNIDIEVLAMRNLALIKAEDRTSALVRLISGAGEVSIYRNGSLYLTRHFQLAYSGGLLDEIPTDALALEVQRSFDYFERQMGQVPPSVLFLCGEGVGEEKISVELKRSLPAAIEVLDLNEELQFSEENRDEGIFQLCVAALGATYRQELA